MKIVLIAAWVLAAISAFIIYPDLAYIDYIDFHTLGLLFCLMAVMAGLQRMGVFRFIAEKMLAKVKNTLQLELILVGLCFFSSMIITNDVALITFVPFAIEVLAMADMKKAYVPVVVFQTIAANLGSMLTPIGNPQNLYLYSQSGYSIGKFIGLMLPYALLSFVLILACLLMRKKAILTLDNMEKSLFEADKKMMIVYIVLFVLSLGCVAKIVPVWIVVILTIVGLIIFDRHTLKHVDYSLLLTFAGFFIFIGNMGRIPAFCDLLASIINGREVLTAAISSQVISNVPAALLLSGFTNKWDTLIVGTNIGGLGTLIASMASLISYKFICESAPKEKGSYFKLFTLLNVIFLVIMLVFAWILM